MAVDVSVVIPTFRRPQQLLEAVSSALSQEGVRVEVVVVDDSPEGSAEGAISKLGDARVRYRKREQPSGGRPALVRNEGARLAQGRYVHFLDDDDLVASGTYLEAVAALDGNPGKGVAFGRVEPFGEDPVVLADQQSYFRSATQRARLGAWLDSPRFLVANMLFKPTVLVNSACLIRRECIEPLHGYNCEIDIVEDVDFFIRAIRRFGFVFLDRVVIHYRTGAPSLMHNLEGDEKALRSYARIYDKYQHDHGALEFYALKLFARVAMKRISAST